jgi:hypothetical protein
MEDLTELMRRLLEIQSGGRQRNADLVAEDQRPRISVALDYLPDGAPAIPATAKQTISRRGLRSRSASE